MNAIQGMYPLERSTPSLQRREPLLGGSPAPAGALFVLGEHGAFGNWGDEWAQALSPLMSRI
ncbi:hypothetical protein [Tamaricihabitans halophyticus]|uniref:hypothetical protein n=1 Tax=Tamaricihabitans halophyticus TaxID=1262583 RepID=UPI00104BE76E|nr:hypothetical protein [Tamaricihabitans halophyticus]